VAAGAQVIEEGCGERLIRVLSRLERHLFALPPRKMHLARLGIVCEVKHDG
jgi:hypothetical protein